MQNAGIEQLKLNWRYLACDVNPENLHEAIDGARAMKFIGLNLTVPHKLLAVSMMDELDASAKLWGAVNTVRFEERGEKIRAIGYNTDADAIAPAVHEDLRVKLRGSKVLLLGAGGAGRTAALKFASENVGELFLVNRTKSKADAVAIEARRRFPKVPVTVGYPPGRVDLVVNATSLGLKASDPLQFDGKQFSLRQTPAVFDMIYRPAETPLLKAAAKAGCQTANGIAMLLYQGAKALEIWSGKRAPIDVMRWALVKEVYGS